MTRGNQSYWYSFEAIGTTRQLTNAQTQVTDAYAYDAWGNELATQGSTVNPHRYVGKHGYYLDTQSALMLLGVRYYEAGIGRFMTIDPLKVKNNWYAYASNRPTMLIDPNGKFAIIPIVGGCAVQGLLSGIGSYLGGGSACEIACSAAAGCIVGGAQALIISLIGPGAGWEIHCLLSGLSSIVSPLLSEICKSLFCNRCWKPPSLSGPCKAFKGIVGTIGNCLGKWIAEDWAEKIVDTLFTYISRGLGLGCEAYAGFEKRYTLPIAISGRIH
jgi:RHS repeat-associated protein